MQLRRHQREALDAIAASPENRHWVVLPPGAGKTLVGVGAAATWERPVVAFGPNLAIVAQWRSAWESLTGEPATSERSLPTRFTALTYQSLAVFDSESDGETAKARLHQNGQALVDRLHSAGPLTVILDECHHLLEVWGDLLDQVIAELPDAKVIALTATPPELLTPAQAERVDRLFGTVTYEAGIPALVAEGDLAPFAELVWFTFPTARETEWLDSRGVRAAELISELNRVDVKTPLLTFLSLHDFRDLKPDVADAVVRLALAGHLPLPEHAHVYERHRRSVTLEDWLTVADLWLPALRAVSTEDRRFVEHIARLLPGLGFRLTKAGIRPGQPLVDRVLSRSSSKARAATEVVAAALDDPEARLLVLTDFAVASALPADLAGIVEPESGSARWVVEALASDPRIEAARPIMVTGTSIGGRAEVLRELLPGEVIDGEGVVGLESGDASRWLAAATDALNRGWTRCLVGTRGLLGEGWDARAVTGVVDLSSATTSTAIVQTRGRSLRTDPDHPGKVAVNWTVTCVAPDRPQGDADYKRLVRKHAGWFAVDEEGDVVDGVAHLDSRLSPESPPTETPLAELNRRALERAGDLGSIRSAWRGVDPERAHPIATLRIRGERAPAALAVRPSAPGRGALLQPAGVAGGGALVAGVGIALGVLSPALGLVVLAVALVLGVVGWFGTGAAVRRHLAAEPSTADYARAVAEAMLEDGISSVGADGVYVELTADGETRIRLEDPDEAVTEVFSDALAEVLGMIEQPRYLVSRPVWDSATPRLLDPVRAPAPDREVWHQVPSVFGSSRAKADVFTEAWNQQVGAGRSVFVGTPEGAGLLRALKWTSPFGPDAGLSIVERRQW